MDSREQVDAPGADSETSDRAGLVGEGEALTDLDRALTAALSARVEPEQFATWFRRTRLVRVDDRAAVLAVPNEFAREWIGNFYGEVLEAALHATLGAKRRVELRVLPEHSVELASDAGARADHDRGVGPRGGHRANGTAHPLGQAATRPADSSPPPAPGAANTDDSSNGDVSTRGRSEAVPAPADAPVLVTQASFAGPDGDPSIVMNATQAGLLYNSDIVLNPKCTFESFVVGPCNRFGHAASMGAAEQPGKSYNPLFLHGRVGVGKTHLLQALCFMILERYPTSRILYLSCETFVNHFINALENGDMTEFRDKYRNVDVLVVDDIQLLANKERTQEEFFHTFNTLYNAGKQIVLSSDSPPKDIPTLQDRLVSRFKWGMVTEIEPPCYETRVAIVKRKSRDRGREVPDTVAQFIAENIEENVRELEGAVTRLLGYAGLTGQELSREVAREALADLIDVRRGAPAMEDIISVVTEHYSVKLSDLQSRRRTNAIAYPRQVAMYLARKITRHSLEEIGGFFGGRDHTTVIYAVDKIENLCKNDEDTGRLVARFLERLTGRI